jgi:NAD-dependent deacetylase
MERTEIPAEIAARLAVAKNVFVLTGAGLGVASGLGTFRGPSGYWRDRSFEQLASLHGFQENPELVWEWYNERIAAYLVALPNAGHVVLAELQDMVPHFTLATQNVDGLHARAGSRNVWELHGSIFDVLCTGCGVAGRSAIERLEAPFDVRRL